MKKLILAQPLAATNFEISNEKNVVIKFLCGLRYQQRFWGLKEFCLAQILKFLKLLPPRGNLQILRFQPLAAEFQPKISYKISLNSHQMWSYVSAETPQVWGLKECLSEKWQAI